MNKLFIAWISAMILVFGLLSPACSDNESDDENISDGDIDASAEDDAETSENLELAEQGTEDGDVDDDAMESSGDDEMETEKPEDSEESAGMKWPGCDDRLPTQKLTFLHINDLHSEYSTYAGDEYGSSVSRIVGYYKQVKTENPFTVFTNGGDDHEKGSIAEQLSEGYSTVEIVKAMKFDVRVIGNHDFAWGEKELLDYVDDPESIVLASNTEYVGENPSDFRAVKYAELQVGCARVGFFGMTSKPYNEKNQQYDGDFFPGGNFHTDYDYAAVAGAIVAEHRDSVDVLVMVSHLGFGDDKALAEQVPGIDVILGGHSHTIMYEPEIVNGTLIVQSGSDGIFAGRLDLEIDTVHGRIASHTYSLNMNLPTVMPLDDEFQQTLLEIMEKWAPDAFEPEGYLKNNHDYPSVGAITCKAVNYILDTDAALLDNDEIWEAWHEGGMSRQDMLDSFQVEKQPAGSSGFNSFYTAEIGGADLIRVRDEMGEDWSFAGPESIDEGAVYRLALQKHAAFNPQDYLPSGVSITQVEEGDEVWKILDGYARKRTEACLYVDADESLPDCAR